MPALIAPWTAHLLAAALSKQSPPVMVVHVWAACRAESGQTGRPGFASRYACGTLTHQGHSLAASRLGSTPPLSLPTGTPAGYTFGSFETMVGVRSSERA